MPKSPLLQLAFALGIARREIAVALGYLNRLLQPNYSMAAQVLAGWKWPGRERLLRLQKLLKDRGATQSTISKTFVEQRLLFERKGLPLGRAYQKNRDRGDAYLYRPLDPGYLRRFPEDKARERKAKAIELLMPLMELAQSQPVITSDLDQRIAFIHGLTGQHEEGVRIIVERENNLARIREEYFALLEKIERQWRTQRLDRYDDFKQAITAFLPADFRALMGQP